MIEKVARTLARIANQDEDNWRVWGLEARAVIECIASNVTDEMLIEMMVAYDVQSHEPPTAEYSRVEARRTFENAPALKERVRASLKAALIAAVAKEPGHDA